MTKAKKKSSKGVTVAEVGDYAERPYDAALATETTETPRQPDQIADYHETHPTLDVSGPEHDPEVQASVKAGLIETEPVADEPVN